MRNLVFVGYMRNPAEFVYITNKMLIDAMVSLRRDRFLVCDWNHVGEDLSGEDFFNWYTGEKVKFSFNDADSVIVLETPTRISTHVSVEKVFPLLEKMSEEGKAAVLVRKKQGEAYSKVQRAACKLDKWPRSLFIQFLRNLG